MKLRKWFVTGVLVPALVFLAACGKQAGESGGPAGPGSAGPGASAASSVAAGGGSGEWTEAAPGTVLLERDGIVLKAGLVQPGGMRYVATVENNTGEDVIVRCYIGSLNGIVLNADGAVDIPAGESAEMDIVFNAEEVLEHGIGDVGRLGFVFCVAPDEKSLFFIHDYVSVVVDADKVPPVASPGKVVYEDARCVIAVQGFGYNTKEDVFVLRFSVQDIAGGSYYAEMEDAVLNGTDMRALWGPEKEYVANVNSLPYCIGYGEYWILYPTPDDGNLKSPEQVTSALFSFVLYDDDADGRPVVLETGLLPYLP